VESSESGIDRSFNGYIRLTAGQDRSYRHTANWLINWPAAGSRLEDGHERPVDRRPGGAQEIERGMAGRGIGAMSLSGPAIYWTITVPIMPAWNAQ
jgi:hypothetical protein